MYEKEAMQRKTKKEGNDKKYAQKKEETDYC